MRFERHFETIVIRAIGVCGGSNEGDEPFLLEEEFKGRDDWSVLDPAFLDQAPDGFGTALSFFSDEAFRFYLPAYLIADIDGVFQHTDPVFHLCHGLDDSSRHVKINPQRYGERTWFHHVGNKFAMFNQAEIGAIIGYLQFRAESDDLLDLEKAVIEQALDNYWRLREKELS